MGVTLDILNGRAQTYVTCDTCGFPILGRAHVDPPAGARDYERYSHLDGCPTDRDPWHHIEQPPGSAEAAERATTSRGKPRRR